MNGTIEQHQVASELIRLIDAELKIVIPGNHDLTLDPEYYDKSWNLHGPPTKYTPEVLDDIQRIYTSEQAKQAGIVYMTEGTQVFTLKNGATFRVYASAWQPEFWQWAFGYPRDQDRFNPAAPDAAWHPPHPVPNEPIDLMVTHGPPAHILDQTYSGADVGCEHLRRAVERCKPRLHVFGHIHEDWGAVRMNWSVESGGEETSINPDPATKEKNMGVYIDGTNLQHGAETLFVNASIMDLGYHPSQAPWIVDLMLPVSKGKGHSATS